MEEGKQRALERLLSGDLSGTGGTGTHEAATACSEPGDKPPGSVVSSVGGKRKRQKSRGKQQQQQPHQQQQQKQKGGEDIGCEADTDAVALTRRLVEEPLAAHDRTL